jgi:hypothetical protein
MEGKTAKLFVMPTANRYACYLFMQGTGGVLVII